MVLPNLIEPPQIYPIPKFELPKIMEPISQPPIGLIPPQVQVIDHLFIPPTTTQVPTTQTTYVYETPVVQVLKEPTQIQKTAIDPSLLLIGGLGLAIIAILLLKK